MKNPAIAQTVRDVGTAVKEATKDNNKIDTDKVRIHRGRCSLDVHCNCMGRHERTVLWILINYERHQLS